MFTSLRSLLAAESLCDGIRWGPFPFTRVVLAVVSLSINAAFPPGGGLALAQSTDDPSTSAGGQPQGGFMSGEVLVRFADNVSDAEIKQITRDLHAEVVDYVEKIKVYRLRVAGDGNIDDILKFCAEDSRCAYAERNYVGQGGIMPDDTFFRYQWHLDNRGQTGGTKDADIHAREAWKITQGDPTIVVAVLDTGINANNREFRGRLLPGYDFVDEDDRPEAEHPHGSLVTSILAANADNNFGGAGVDQRVTILPVKVLDGNNSGTVIDLAEGLIFAADQGADVINMSLIGYPLSGVLNDALQYARDAGSILIACAGNGGIGDADVSGPGASPLTISVGATDHDDLRAFFSATGRALDVVAPGVDLVTAAIGAGGDRAFVFSGCSAATPVVSGIATLLLSIDPSLSHTDVRAILRRTADDLVGDADEDERGRDDYYGYGRVNLNNALSELVAAVAVDILPRRCPNGFPVMNDQASPLVLTAILGTGTFDVSDVDVATVSLGGVAASPSPKTGLVKDVAKPFFPMLGKRRAKDCGRKGPDRHDDLLLQFDRQEIADRLGPVAHGDVVVLPLTGRLFGGSPFRGEDVVRIRVPRAKRQQLVQSGGS